MVNGLMIGIVAGADQLLVNEKTVHYTDDTFVNEMNNIRFSITDDQYNSYKFLRVDYRNSNPSTSLWLYITSDNLYELYKQGHGITSQGIGTQIFGDGAIYRELNEFKQFSGYNNLRLYGMVRPVGTASDVTFSITLTNNVENKNPTPIPPGGTSSKDTGSHVFISSNQKGADVYIDSNYLGKLPIIDKRDVPLGSHKITVKMNGYVDWEKNVDITKDEISIIAELKPIPTISTTTISTTTSTTAIITQTTKIQSTLKKISPLPTDTPTQPSPLGVEIGITAMIIYAVLVVKRK